MGKIKLTCLNDFRVWKDNEIDETIFKNKFEQLNLINAPKNYPCVLCYSWLAYATQDAYNGHLSFQYVYPGDFE